VAGQINAPAASRHHATTTLPGAALHAVTPCGPEGSRTAWPSQARLRGVMAMIRHWAFFKQGDTSFGTFYPKHYIVAGYACLEEAEAAEHAFIESGVDVDDVRAASGDFVINRLEAHHEANWLQRAQSHIAEFAGTEAGFLEDDAELARKGGAFLFLFAPHDHHVAHARIIFERHRPHYARRYLQVAIERIIDARVRVAD
jgi:hypothetical protein